MPRREGIKKRRAGFNGCTKKLHGSENIVKRFEISSTIDFKRLWKFL
jgi:hypothetical protein